MSKCHQSMKVFITAIVIIVSLNARQANAESPSFSLKRDFAGDVYEIGEIITVEWDATGIDNIRGATVSLTTDDSIWVELNPDGVIKPDDPEWGKVEWTIPEKAFADGFGFVSVVGDSVRIRVFDNRNPEFVTYSEYFSIEGEVSIQSRLQHSTTAPDINLSLKPDELLINGATGVSARVSVFTVSGKRIETFNMDKKLNSRFVFSRKLSGGTYLIHLESVREKQPCSKVFMRLIR